MIDTTFGRHPRIAVAVAFDAHTPALVAAATRLAAATGQELLLINVQEPWLDLPYQLPYSDRTELWQAREAAQRTGEQQARQRLAELAARLRQETPGLRVETATAAGRPAETLAAEALAHDAGLLLVGADFASARHTPRGFSTALSLMAGAPVPVCVLDGTLGHTLPPAEPRLLLADDLGASSDAAARFTFALAARLGHARVLHSHVCGVTEDALGTALTTALAATHTPSDAAVSAGEVLAGLTRDLQAQLLRRAETFRKVLADAGSRVEVEVRTGSVHTELGATAATFAPHVVVLGRHHAYYTKPFQLGRLPYRAMLTFRKPLIIVPND